MQCETPAFFVFVASTQLGRDGEDVPASVVFRELIATNNWFLGKRTPFRTAYKQGDKVLFYLAGVGHRFFAGTAAVLSAPCPISASEARALADFGLFGYDLALPLSDVDIWTTPKSIRDFVYRLDFITDKRNYGLHFRQGATRISEADYALVAGH